MSNVVMIDFLDHAENFPEPVRCRVYGLLVDEGPDHWVVETWTMVDPAQAKALQDVSTFTILKSTITATQVLA